MTLYVNPGRLGKRVLIQQYNESAARNPAGGIAPQAPTTYTDVGMHWAGIEALSGAEKEQDGRVQSQETHRIVMRSDGVTGRLRARDRVVYTDRWQVAHVYDLVSAFDPDQQGRMVHARAIYRPDANIEI